MGILAAPHSLVPAPAQRGNDIVACLYEWQRAATTLCFVYARSLGGLMQSGRGRIAVLNEMALTIDAGGSTLLVMLSGAVFDDTPQIFFTSDLGSHFQVDGIGIALGNHDWLFFSPDEVPQAAVIGSRMPA